MKITFLTACLFISGLIAAQQQLQNGNFEVWENVGTATEEPENWSSLKTADALAITAPQVLTQDAGRNGGFCARLEVKSVFGIEANGIMTNGRVHADFNPENGYVYTEETNPQWYTTFTDRPDSIVGWYKYDPKNGDKGKVEVILHVDEGQLPFNGLQANIVARAKVEFTQNQLDWVRFSTPFIYWSATTPQYVLTTIAAGDSTISENETILWVDDLELIYNDPTSGLGDSQLLDVAINASNGFLYFDVDFDASYIVYFASGQIVQRGKTAQKVPFYNEAGIYFIELITPSEVIRKKLYIY